MTVYDSGASAYRDTAKWLTAFVPVTALVSATVVMAPRFMRLARRSEDLATFAADNAVALVAVASVLAGAVLVLWKGAGVLSAQPTDFDEIVTDDRRLAAAFSAGIGAPYFLDATTFVTAIRGLQTAWDEKKKVPPDDPDLIRTLGTVESLREWSLHSNLTSRFESFGQAFALSVVLIVFGSAVAAFATDVPEAEITKPTEVTVRLDATGAEDLEAETGCSEPTRTTFLAVGGDWGDPILVAAEGPDCDFAVEWSPPESSFVLQP